MQADLPARASARGALLPAAGVCLAGLLAGCTGSTGTTWVQYNAADNTVSIDVGAAAVEDPVSVTLTSNTGAVELGTGTVDPGGGPIGTMHTVTVSVSSDYASDIGRASVRLDSGSRGVDEYDMDADSTGEGYWVVQLQSVGDVGETRTDSLTFRLWTASGADSGSSGLGITL